MVSAEVMGKMKIYVHGNKSEGNILAFTLVIFVASCLLMLGFYSLTTARYKLTKKKYDSFYENLEKNNSDIKENNYEFD